MNIIDLIKRENFAEGPFKYSGGVVHKVDDATAEAVAIGIANASNSWALGADGVKIICAFLRGESNFDPDSFCPNLEDAPGADHVLKIGGKWPDAQSEAAHTDYGLCMVNGNGSYAGKGAIKESLDYLCAAIIRNLGWAAVNNYPPEVAYEAYNQGRTGAANLYKSGGVAACTYGHIVAERIAEYVALDVI